MLIWSLPQLIYNHIKDVNDPYWQWFLEIQKFLRYMLMHEISDNQIDEMKFVLDSMMNTRLKLTKILVTKMNENNLEYKQNKESDDEKVLVNQVTVVKMKTITKNHVILNMILLLDIKSMHYLTCQKTYETWHHCLFLIQVVLDIDGFKIYIFRTYIAYLTRCCSAVLLAYIKNVSK